MDIVIKCEPGDDCGESQNMMIDGKERLRVGPLCECPEDAIIGRDLVSCCDVAEYMRQAYEAGKRGEVFNLQVVWPEQT